MKTAGHTDSCTCLACRPSPVHRRVHKIGRIELTVHVVRKTKWYEVLYDGRMIVQARDWPQDALRIARNAIPPKPSKRIQGEILAYRGWGLIGDLLLPLTRADDYDSWSGPVASVAELDTFERGTNGLWAVRIERSRDLLFSYHPTVHGIVALSGTVVEYETGYRAQRQIIRVLRVVPPVGDIIIKALEDRYQCQVFRQKKV